MNTAEEQRSSPLLGCVADDVTGATDIALNLVAGGMRVVQLLGMPDADAASLVRDFDAVVVALKTRSIPKADAIDQSVKALNALRGFGCERFYFKYCSTFDSTEQGNIGPVAESLMSALGVTQTIYCPSFPRAGRTVFQGHLFVGQALLSESGMEKHPLNPMNDSNLVRFLAKQSSRKVGLLPHESICGGAGQASSILAELAARGATNIVTDTVSDSDLEVLAELAVGMPLVTGGSGLARFLPAAYRASGIGRTGEASPQLPDVDGRAAIIAGSCSRATIAQVQSMRTKCPTWQIDVSAVMRDADAERQRLESWIAKTDSSAPLLIASTESAEKVDALQTQFGAEAVAGSIETFLSDIAAHLNEHCGVRRFVLAGGETSGAIVSRLGVRALRIGPEICVGVPWTESIGEPRLALTLKSGNFGSDDFFSTALEMLR